MITREQAIELMKEDDKRRVVVTYELFDGELDKLSDEENRERVIIKNVGPGNPDESSEEEMPI